MFDKYGFYDAIDFTPERLDINKKYSPVKTYMAHHQGLILLSLNNFFNNNILQKRFSKNPEIEAVNILLEEVMPEKTINFGQRQEEVKKLKYKDYENGYEKIINKLNPNIINTNILSNGNYTVAITDRAEGYSKLGDIYINRFKSTCDETYGMLFYIKNIKSKRIWTSGDSNYLSKADKYNVSFKTDSCKFIRTDGNIETTTGIVVGTEDNVEIRRIELKNNGNIQEMLEVTSYFEPVLSRKEADYAHRAFNNLFLSYEAVDNETIIVTRKKREQSDADIFIGVSFLSNGDTIGELEFEIDKEKFMGRNNFNIPKMVEESKPLTKNIGIVTDPIMAFKRTVKLRPK